MLRELLSPVYYSTTRIDTFAHPTQVGGGLPSFHFFSGDSPLVAFRGLSSSTPEWLAW